MSKLSDEQINYWQEAGRREADRSVRNTSGRPGCITRGRRDLIRATRTSAEQSIALDAYGLRWREILDMPMAELDKFFWDENRTSGG